MRRNRIFAAGALALALAAGGGWMAQAGTEDAPAQATANKRFSYEVVRLANKNVGDFERRVAHCPPGKKVIGGGAEARGNKAVLVGSFPTDDNTGWIGLGRQPGHDTVGISVFAICSYVF